MRLHLVFDMLDHATEYVRPVLESLLQIDLARHKHALTVEAFARKQTPTFHGR